MILLLNKIPVTLEVKIKKMISIAQQAMGSEFYNTNGSRWLGDRLTIKSLFPKWILKEADQDPSNVLITEIVKSYQRWLFDLERGYGATVPWDRIRVVEKIPDKLLIAIADSYFPSQDFSTEPLASVLPNIRKFAIHANKNYFRKKGTADAIKYLLITLLGLPYDNCEVVTGSPGFLIVMANVPDQYKPFLNKCVYPAGITVLYKSV